MNTSEDDKITVSAFSNVSSCAEGLWEFESCSSNSPTAEFVYAESAANSDSPCGFWTSYLEPYLSDSQETWDSELGLYRLTPDSSLLDPVTTLDFHLDLEPASSFPSLIPYDFQSTCDAVHIDWADNSGSMSRLASQAPTDCTSSDTVSEPSTIGSPRFSPSRYLGTDRTCHQCKRNFSRVVDMELHGREEGHKPFACSLCPKLFSRQDALTRHREIHKSLKRYACQYCEKYRGQSAFKRRDHLRQHLRKKHRVHPNLEFPLYCHYEQCSSSESEGSFDGFQSRTEYSRHMRDSHGEEKHDCEIRGCDRVGRKGFARLSDLEKHKSRHFDR